MLIKDYVREYTSGERVVFWQVLAEVKEFMAEAVRWSRPGMREEGQDVLHFFQLWLFWRFGINGEIWPCTMDSVNKFKNRLFIWRQLYAFVGLPSTISNFCGNCQKEEKVVKHLAKFGVKPEQAIAAYRAIVAVKK